jgi:hypothetical protein
MENGTTRSATAGVPAYPGSTAGTPSRQSCDTVQNYFRLLDRYPQFRFNQAKASHGLPEIPGEEPSGPARSPFPSCYMSSSVPMTRTSTEAVYRK